jgi:N-acetylmuramoyl-L-alanine amidase
MGVSFERVWGEGVPVRKLWFLLLLYASGVAQATELRDVRVWASPEGTRIVFDLDRTAQHSLFLLDNPSRIVIDLEKTQRAQAVAAKIEGKGLVDRVRSAPYGRDELRVVLDLNQPVKSKSFALPPNDSYGYRVVVDLTPSTPAPAMAATPAPVVSAPPVRAHSKTIVTEKPIVVAIDAGHGGEDPGTRGRRGLLEKDVSLALARRLARLVSQEPGLRAVLIRDGDYYIGLRERTAKARDANADLFISIHANSFKDPTVRGTAVYVLSPKGASSEHAMMVENRENMADLIGGVESDRRDDTTMAVLADIFQTSAMEASHDAGGRILDAMSRVNPLQKPRVQQASFVVLKSASFPSVLVETAFLTNDREERLLGDPGYQENLARSMLEGIKGYFKSYRPLEQMAERPGGSSLQPVSMQGFAGR